MSREPRIMFNLRLNLTLTEVNTLRKAVQCLKESLNESDVEWSIANDIQDVIQIEMENETT